MQRSQRLRRPDQFGRVRREGKTWAHRLLTLNAARNRAGRTRCGFVVGKQIGKAHDRNRAKRRVREAVRLAFGNIVAGWDLVFVVRPPAVAVPFPVLCTAVEDVVRRASLWRAPDVDHGSVANATSTRAPAHPPLPAPVAPDPG